eukprot:4261903-Pleurochrysis_carterae.AAC.1
MLALHQQDAFKRSGSAGTTNILTSSNSLGAVVRPNSDQAADTLTLILSLPLELHTQVLMQLDARDLVRFVELTNKQLSRALYCVMEQLWSSLYNDLMTELNSEDRSIAIQ